MKTFFSTITYTTYHQAWLMLRWYFEIRRESNYGCNHVEVFLLQNCLRKCKGLYLFCKIKYVSLRIYEDSFEGLLRTKANP